MDNELLVGFCKLFKRYASGDAVIVTEVNKILKFHVVFLPVTPWPYGTLFNGKGFVWNDKVKINVDDPAKTSTGLTCSYGTIKREKVRRWPRVGYLTPCTLELIAEGKVCVRFYPQIQVACSKTEGLLQ
ncbi:hypothetical protein ES703_93438 [subsurface metagenome]